MAMKISDDCSVCAGCEDECPNLAIELSPDSGIFEIDPALCNECLGYAPEPSCAAACPQQCIEKIDSEMPQPVSVR